MSHVITGVTFILAIYLAVLSGIAGKGRAYPDHPLPGHTGGFGEPSCHTCHFDYPPNEPGGRLSVRVLPSEDDSTSNTITVSLEHPEMKRAGFQAAVRSESGEQHGRLYSIDERTVVTELDGIQYVHHTLDGTNLTDEGKAVWTFGWTPSRIPRVPILIHVAANASNDDASEFGDIIYTDSHSINED